ncbi:hypothetical protein [Phytoactinopolyspora mesophila]|uniref:DUF4333 domain-containing protein n=1 Tax=Phytoactinopolyspora mesophila TaxID=2650750 RepID=A0A7K3M017_9ACTN|nr:hypothetical protein [Phytoactinopolyspora mesophila]NDL56262.1 hypothetical protein [Phytoactinopolyspora mesophila]
MRRLLVVLVLPLLAVTGCSEITDRLSGSIDAAASRALEKGIQDQLAQAGIELQGKPDCATDLTRSGTSLAGTARCEARTTDGHAATATFDGTMSSSGCTGTVTVVVEGRTVVNAAEVPDCSVSL